jgi:hypothetical protein
MSDDGRYAAVKSVSGSCSVWTSTGSIRPAAPTKTSGDVRSIFQFSLEYKPYELSAQQPRPVLYLLQLSGRRNQRLRFYLFVYDLTGPKLIQSYRFDRKVTFYLGEHTANSAPIQTQKTYISFILTAPRSTIVRFLTGRLLSFYRLHLGTLSGKSDLLLTYSFSKDCNYVYRGSSLIRQIDGIDAPVVGGSVSHDGKTLLLCSEAGTAWLAGNEAVFPTRRRANIITTAKAFPTKG